MPQNPLAVDGVEAGGVEGDAETGEPFKAEESSQPELASVPSFATEQMRLALGGPGAPSKAKARLWAVTTALCWVSAADVCWFGLPLIDESLTSGAELGATLLCVSTVTQTAAIQLSWHALYSPDAQQGGAGQLLRAELTLDAWPR